MMLSRKKYDIKTYRGDKKFSAFCGESDGLDFRYKIWNDLYHVNDYARRSEGFSRLLSIRRILRGSFRRMGKRNAICLKNDPTRLPPAVRNVRESSIKWYWRSKKIKMFQQPVGKLG